MAYPDLKEQFILDTDANRYGIRAVLFQVQDGKERVILVRTDYRALTSLLNLTYRHVDALFRVCASSAGIKKAVFLC